MILSCNNITKTFGTDAILSDCSFHIEEREKAALIGNNGAGKTTLLRIIMEEIHADAGQVVLAKDKRIGYLWWKRHPAQSCWRICPYQRQGHR